MSSMVRTTFALLLASLAITPSVASAQDGADWDRARAAQAAAPASPMTQAVARWKLLTSSDRFLFDDYASFLLSYPGFPEEAKLRGYAERALERESPQAERISAFFDRYPAVTNAARARHALALFDLGRPEATELGRSVWRGGPMSDLSEAALSARLANVLTPADHGARMDALLWNNNSAQATRQLLYISPAARPVFLARLGLVNGQDPAAQGLD
ncbi:MAG: lytic transglycosylase domain-containing protein, partial [Novosphingobium sp.]